MDLRSRIAALRPPNRTTAEGLRCVSGRLRAAAKTVPGLLAMAVLLAACAGDAAPGEQLRPGGPDSPGDRLGAPWGLSPGDGLVYVVADPEDPRRLDLWRARLSDGAVRPLIQTPDRCEEFPAWSERASALVFQTRSPYSWRSPPRLKLWQAGTEREIPGSRAISETEPAWEPRGTHLAYVFRRLRPEDTRGIIPTGVIVVDVETGKQAILAQGLREHYSRPAFSPDGRHIVAEYRTEFGGAARIARLDPEGQPQLLTSDADHAEAPSFTRDGSYVVFTRRPSRRGPADVMRMEPDGSKLRSLTGAPESNDVQAVPSPTRNEIAFLSDRDGKPDLFLIGLEGGPGRNLTASLDVGVLWSRWSPNGEHLAVSALPHVGRGPGEDEREPGLADARLLVIDRQGRILFKTRGFSADWMPPWE